MSSSKDEAGESRDSRGSRHNMRRLKAKASKFFKSKPDFNDKDIDADIAESPHTSKFSSNANPEAVFSSRHLPIYDEMANRQNEFIERTESDDDNMQTGDLQTDSSTIIEESDTEGSGDITPKASQISFPTPSNFVPASNLVPPSTPESLRNKVSRIFHRPLPPLISTVPSSPLPPPPPIPRPAPPPRPPRPTEDVDWEIVALQEDTTHRTYLPISPMITDWREPSPFPSIDSVSSPASSKAAASGPVPVFPSAPRTPLTASHLLPFAITPSSGSTPPSHPLAHRQVTLLSSSTSPPTSSPLALSLVNTSDLPDLPKSPDPVDGEEEEREVDTGPMGRDGLFSMEMLDHGRGIRIERISDGANGGVRGMLLVDGLGFRYFVPDV
ncbi:hypothetical protein B0J11DRAFT_581463 [Dendryphion nanum]|uniref:Uncharacterized protein n=1 Tax=Dendryphion nanum TaxID=256645 RepID=A0A9P9DPA0_9PLEO|nr:hypothetical protein B0J11DRAFT_581463 [Dendryphion nanum]